MTSVNALSGSPRPPVERGLHIAGLFGLALKRLRAEIEIDSERGFPDLRVSHYRLLELIPDSGARITDLAEIAGMTKQGLGQHVDYLDKLGFTESDRLPEDRRVRLVRRTGKGDEAVAFSHAAIGRVEQAWKEQLGPERYELLRGMLLELCQPFTDELEWLERD
ncbi:winged helix-turn-helix transcriptional regulator [Kribbella qitaiheensis]|uniref:Winged helix-turn-helix transcriptional regulator n=1 Tax=Kribbella qitaiheensis TaxID=1544730 RepID=A0A7G6WX21_9ACTN|nr:MarR family winged helix-turn-helix transcriptional regulator [Kribbella qitaiheensis]QNE18536.1 winged helix-turn-helix transcriptional regulator [Kribbella qitaiheensis]